MTATRVHRILDEVGALAFPGVYDTLSARIAERVGFPMAFVSGYSVAATAIGEPDMGLLTQTEMIDRARRICMSVSIPIIVDADTGYGNPLNVHRTVHELIARARPAASWKTRSGPRSAATCAARRSSTATTMCRRSARPSMPAATAISSSSPGPMPWLPSDLDEAIRRVRGRPRGRRRCQLRRGADLAGRPREIGRRSPAPNVANMIEGGKTPVLPKQQLVDLGFQLILYPLTGLFASARLIESLYRTLKEDGTTKARDCSG